MAATLRTVIGTLVHHINATDAGKGNSVAEVEGPLETVRKKATENVIDHFVSLGDEGGHDGDVTTTSSKSRHEDLDSIVGAPNEKGDNEGMQSAPLTRRRNSTFAVVKAAFKENAPSVHVSYLITPEQLPFTVLQSRILVQLLSKRAVRFCVDP